MTNRIALWLGAILIAGILVDVVFFDAENLLFLSKKMLDLIDWVAFWR